jgi:hypothetical protein
MYSNAVASRRDLRARPFPYFALLGHSHLEFQEPAILEPVQLKDRHVVAAAMAVRADAIVTFNIADFAAAHLQEHLQIEVLHPDDFVMDLVDLNEKRAGGDNGVWKNGRRGRFDCPSRTQLPGSHAARRRYGPMSSYRFGVGRELSPPAYPPASRADEVRDSVNTQC